MNRWGRSAQVQFIVALLASSLVSILLFGYTALRNHNAEFGYLVWNLFLAWLPLLFAIKLIHVLRYKRWSSWEGIGWSLLWLLFLPNSFYMISDFIHLWEVRRVDLLYDTVMFTAFIYTGVILGFSSLYLLHVQLKKRLTASPAAIWIGATLFLCSAAIYIGRDLRWNSWDVLFNPGGLLFDISDRLMRPAAYPQMLTTILTFFVLLSTMYALLWYGIRLLQAGTVKEERVRYIAFYGTLKRAGGTPLHPLIREHLIYEGNCRISGNLFNLGRLKGLEPGSGEVAGELYKLKDLQILPNLDAYEAVDNENPASPGYSRRLVRLIKPRVLAWVYFYDGDTHGHPE